MIEKAPIIDTLSTLANNWRNRSFQDIAKNKDSIKQYAQTQNCEYIGHGSRSLVLARDQYYVVSQFWQSPTEIELKQIQLAHSILRDIWPEHFPNIRTYEIRENNHITASGTIRRRVHPILFQSPILIPDRKDNIRLFDIQYTLLPYLGLPFGLDLQIPGIFNRDTVKQMYVDLIYPVNRTVHPIRLKKYLQGEDKIYPLAEGITYTEEQITRTFSNLKAYNKL